jgi:hypothetical protein
MPIDWQVVETSEDAERVLDLFGGFHDSCLREAHLWTETWVADDLSMACPGRLDTHVRMLFQRQFRAPSAIELLFDEVVAFHVAPSPEGYDSIIFDAALFIRGDLIYWADSAKLGARAPAAG